MQSLSRIRELLELIVCPACHARLTLKERPAAVVVCAACARRYPVQDGIPILLVPRAALPPQSGGS
jgi:uncharacterized protein YbaR (Trm112 family)